MPTKYYLKRNERIRGPFSGSQLKQMLADKRLKSTDLISVSPEGKWAKVANVFQKRSKTKTGPDREVVGDRRPKKAVGRKTEVARGFRRKLLIGAVGCSVLTVASIAGWLCWPELNSGPNRVAEMANSGMAVSTVVNETESESRENTTDNADAQQTAKNEVMATFLGADSIIAAYSFSEQGVRKSERSPELTLQNAHFQSNGVWLSGECYYEYLDEYSYIMEQDGYWVAAQIPRLTADAFAVALRIKPESFPVSPPQLGWNDNHGSILVGGALGTGWFRLLTNPDGRLSLVLRAQQRQWEAIDVGLALETGRWQALAVGVNTAAKSVTVRVDDKTRTLELPGDTDVSVLAAHVERDPTWSFAYPIKGTAYHGMVEWLAVANGEGLSEGQMSLPDDTTAIRQPDAAKPAIETNNVVSLSDSEKALRQCFLKAEQSPILHDVWNLMDGVEAKEPSYFRKFDFIFKFEKQDKEWSKETSANAVFEGLTERLNLLAEFRRSEEKTDLSRRKLQDLVAKEIGYLFCCAKRHELNAEPLKLPVDFEEQYREIIQLALQCFGKPVRQGEDSLFGIAAKAAASTKSEVLKAALAPSKTASAGELPMPSGTEILQDVSLANSSLAFGWRAVKAGKYEPQHGSRTVPASQHLEKVDSALARLIPLARTSVLEENVLLALQKEVEKLLRHRIDMETYISQAKSERAESAPAP